MSAESANPRGKAVEMFGDILAEIREYGEGFVIVDQVPAKLAPDVLKNTNLKILHRIVAEDDRESVGNAMNLTGEQKEQVVRLRVGQAVVHNELLDRPVLLQIHAVKDNLREQFDRDIGREGLKKRMSAFQDQVRDIYRRWPGCHACDAPCTYYSELNAPETASYEAFQTFLSSLMAATPATALEVWRRTRRALIDGLRKKYEGATPSRGVVQCHITELAHVALREWMAYHKGGMGGYRSYIKLEELLLRALPAMLEGSAFPPEAAEAMVAFVEEMGRKVAVEPRRQEPGCRFCRRPCWYGFTVQRDLSGKARGLAEKLKAAGETPDFVNNFDRLVTLVRQFTCDVTPFPVAPRHLQGLAYCYLVNSGAKRPNVLEGFQAAGQKMDAPAQTKTP